MNKAQQAFEKERRGVPPAPVVTKAETVVPVIVPEPPTMIPLDDVRRAFDALESHLRADLDLTKSAIESLQSRCSSLENRLSSIEKAAQDAAADAVAAVEGEHV